eukprot:TRINITY_DN13746_c0_g1_i2.p1 TRINITY_DN13746_c0_g1~~TRINITY_DN13746_c0_g1_i2.p1  ORF type:complete len:111 (+),score=12.12 TRINITY_DN13746_c0_g1_i2:91-423(+)
MQPQLYHERLASNEDPSNRVARVPVVPLNGLAPPSRSDPSNRLNGLPTSPMNGYSNGLSPRVLAVSPHSISPSGLSPSPKLNAPVFIRTTNGTGMAMPPPQRRQTDLELL